MSDIILIIVMLLLGALIGGACLPGSLSTKAIQRAQEVCAQNKGINSVKSNGFFAVGDGFEVYCNNGVNYSGL